MSRHPFNSRSVNNGFSLIELIATIVIIGILAAATGPRFLNSYAAFYETGYADEVAAAIRYANSVAVASGCDTSVDLITIPNGYQVVQRAAGAGNTCVIAGGWSAIPIWRIDGGPLKGNAPSNITLTPATRITFKSDGTVIGGNPPTLQVGTRRIIINATTGLVIVQ